MADKAPLVIDAGQVRQAAAGDVIVCPGITNSALTSGRVVLVGVDGVLEDDANLTFDGTTLSAKSIELVSTTSSAVGVITQDSVRLMHTYADPTADGNNLFIGSLAGNFTMSPAGGASNLASLNVGIGRNALNDLTTGRNNLAFGAGAAWKLTSGVFNMAFGALALGSCLTGNNNACVGDQALYKVTGSNNTAIGRAAGWYNTGNSSIFIGYYAGFYETAGDKLYIDSLARASEADGRVKAMMYGVFASTAVAQDLTFNAQVGVNIPPTAWLTLRAGSAAAGTAPLKLTSGTNLTTPEAGTIEYEGTRFYITGSGARRVISRASDVITTAATAANTTAEITVFTAVLPANTLAAGKVYTVLGYGKASTQNASATLIIRVKVDGVTLVTLACTPGQAANDPMCYRLTFTVRTIGATGAISSHGDIEVKDSKVHTNTSSTVVDTTAVGGVTVTFQWDNAHADNTATLDQGFLKLNN